MWSNTMGTRALMLMIAVAFIFLLGCENEDEGVTGTTRSSYSLRDVYWTNRPDADHDGYTTSGTLNVEVDLGKNVTREITVRLFTKYANETTWTFVKDKTVNVFGGRNDAIKFSGISSQNYYGLYDFRLIIAGWNGGTLEWNTEVIPGDDTDLNHQKFEYGYEDLRYEP